MLSLSAAVLCLMLCVLSYARADDYSALPPVDGQPVDISPQQVHLAMGASSSTMFVNWVTWTAPSHSSLSYGTSRAALNTTVAAAVRLWTDGGAARLNRSMHSVTLEPLAAGTRFFYSITTANKSSVVTSEVFQFRTPSATAGTGDSEPLRIAMFGDFGLVNGESTHVCLERQAKRDVLDLIVHVGDIAYNMDTRNGTVGDSFMRREQSVMSRVPYQVAPGNHEAAYNFSNFRERFAMPNRASHSPVNLYSSHNLGPVHFIAFDAERYFFTNYYTMLHVRAQYEWLQQDLEQARKDRHIRPWIVAYAHRPMYCTHIADDWNAPYCTEDAAAVRDGVAFDGGLRQYGLEALFHNYSVDLYVSGHMHSYERTFPVYREQVVNTDYVGNAGMWHLIVGAPGCCQGLDVFDEAAVYPWSASRSDTYGYGVLSVYNATHMHWAQILDEDESVLDQVWVSKPEIKQPAAAAGVAAAAA